MRCAEGMVMVVGCNVKAFVRHGCTQNTAVYGQSGAAAPEPGRQH